MGWQVWLYAAAVLIPLGAFVIQLLFIRALGRLNAYLATGAIALSFVFSVIGFVSYFSQAKGVLSRHAVAQEGPAAVVEGEPNAEEPAVIARHEPLAWKGGFDWVALGSDTTEPGPDALTIRLGLHIDNLAVIMFLMITLVALLIHVYSIGYMRGDPRYPTYFAYLSLFSFAMLGLVAASNVFLVFVFWELVGLCSYLLIGFWYEEKKNADAATKAFVTNRVGDVGMLVGLGILWSTFGTLDIDRLNRGLSAPELRDSKTLRLSALKTSDTVTVRVSTAGEGETTYKMPYVMLVAAGLGIFAGCVGKSAQFPLHVWLPDAMAGPTPVSALIHAATMVAAGVYLVGRFYPLFTEEVLLVIAYTGGITLFLGASIAIVQTDYKKVLAYSTISQLGYMMLGLGVGGWAAGLFHLITHAFSKALLFLGAGSVHQRVHTYELPVLGGLGKRMPRTAIAMGIGTLSLSGVPLFGGFYSKDAILASAFYRVFMERGQSGHALLFVLPAVGAAMSAFYLGRMWLLLFAGEPRGYPVPDVEGRDDMFVSHVPAFGPDRNPAAHAVESPPILTWPLMILAFFAVFAGWTLWLGLPIDVPVLEQLLAYGEPVATVDAWSAHYFAMFGSLLVATAAIGGAIAFYAPPWANVFGFEIPPRLRRRFEARHPAERLGFIYRFLVKKWYFDELYRLVLVRPTLALSRLCRGFDEAIVDGLVNASAWVTRGLSRLEGIFDRAAVDGLVRLVGHGVYATGDWGRSIQTGRLRNYLMFLAVALVGLCAGVFAWIKG